MIKAEKGNNKLKLKGVEVMQLKTAKTQNQPQKGKLLPRCKLCEEVPTQGIRGGYLISGLFICKKCEAMIVRLQVGSRDYEELLQKIKRFWE